LVICRTRLSQKYGLRIEQIDFKALPDADWTDSFQAAYEMEVTPMENLRRNRWKPPKPDPEEKTFFTDGGYKHDTKDGSAAVVGPGQNLCRRVDLSSSSYSVELHGTELFCKSALEFDDCVLCCVTDSASILAGIKSWGFKHLSSLQLRIFSMLGKLRRQGNRVKFRFCPSHLLSGVEAIRKFLCKDTCGNQQADSDCSHLLSNTTTPTGSQLDPEQDFLSVELILQVAKAIRNRRCSFANLDSFFPKFIEKKWSNALAKKLRRRPRHQATTMLRLLSNHANTNGQWTHIIDDQKVSTNCRYCSTTRESPFHLVSECTHEEVVAARLAAGVTSLENASKENYAKTLMNPEHWHSFHLFFQQLDISV